VPDQHVAEEIRRGYKLRERLLRPAMCAWPIIRNRQASEYKDKREQSRLLRGSGRNP